uniref:Glomulin n=1 Tax=Ciona savignyi TaxID=51511 RepID=H2ZQL5_CIOSA
YNKLTYDLTAVNQISKEFNEEPVLEVLETAISIAVQCPSRTLRQRGIQFVAKFLDKFAWLDRAHLLHRLLFTTQHYGVKGYLSGYFKDKLSVILQESFPPNCAPFISNPRFSAILDQILILSNGSESDLLQEHDLVMSGLNLLRFLLIRDSKHQTCIWNRMKKIEENYISPLRTGLNLSRMHYKEELRKIMNPKKETPSSAFAMNGIDLPSIPVKDRKQVIESAIHSFDMMQGVCSRVQQLIDEKT